MDEFSSGSCLIILPRSAWVLLYKICKHSFSALYMLQNVGKAAQVCPVMDTISFDGRCGLEEEDIIRGVDGGELFSRAVPFGSLGRKFLAP